MLLTSSFSCRVKLTRAILPIAWCISAFALFCVTSSALNPDWQLYQYGHRTWKIADGFLPGPVHAVAQDSNGYLWVATDQGLFHFDGVRFTPWTPPDGSQLPSMIFCLLADQDGGVWIGTIDGLLHWDRHTLIRFAEHQHALVEQILQDANGVVWFVPTQVGTTPYSRLCRVSHSADLCYETGMDLRSMPVTAAASDSAGNIWLGGPDSIAKWTNGSAKVYRPSVLKNNQHQGGINTLAVDSDGSLLVGMGKTGPGRGLQRFKDGRFTPVILPGFDGSRHRILRLFVDHFHAIWVGTEDDGVYRLYHGIAEQFTNRDGLSGIPIESFYEDREGSLWIATKAGLDQFRDLSIRTFLRTVYPKATEFDNVVARQNGDLWIGGAGTLYTLKSGTNEFTARAPSLKGKQVTTIFTDGAGRTWIGLDNTLNIFSRGKFKPVKMADGRPTGFIVSMAEDTDGVLWAISLGPPRAILSIDAKALRALPVEPVMAAKIARDPRGGLWMGSTTGDIMHFSKGTITALAFPHDSQTWTNQLTVLTNGEVLAASAYGLADVVDNKIRVLSAHNGLPCSHINDFVFDTKGNLWLYAICGLIEVSQSQFQQWQNDPSTRVQSRTFDSTDGLRIHFPPFEGTARAGDGRLWFNSWDALQMVDPLHLHFNAIPPPVHIEAIRADFQDQALAETVRLPLLTREIEISYTALSFTAPQKIQFRYRLSGFDHDWHDVGGRRQAVYTNLRPGTYTFQVVAANNDGVWNNTGDSLSFTIPPKFYQTAWFRALCLLVFLMVLWGGYQLRLHQLERQYNMRVEERVNERTRIAQDLHDTLLQHLHGLMFEFQAARNLFEKRPHEALLTLDDAVMGTERAITESQEAIQGLRADAVANQDIGQLLKETAEELAAARLADHEPPSFGLTVEGEQRDLVPIVREGVYRIAREVVRNAFRHAQAHRIEAEILYGDHQFRVRVRDDGRGMPPQMLEKAGRAGHWGLTGIRERAQKIGATLDFWSEVGAGTEMQLTVPASTAYEKNPDRSRLRLFRGMQTHEHRS